MAAQEARTGVPITEDGVTFLGKMSGLPSPTAGAPSPHLLGVVGPSHLVTFRVCGSGEMLANHR